MSDLIALFTRASKLMRAAADHAYGRHGVRVGQNLVLEILWEEDGRPPGEIARRLGVTTPTIVKMADRMQATGLVTRRPDEHDARVVRLHLTDRGHALRSPILAERAHLAERATATLGERERRTLEAALTKMIANLEPVAPIAEVEPDE